MSKHKTVEKWVAWIDNNWTQQTDSVRTAKIEVVETKLQYRIDCNGEAYRNAMQGTGYKRVINKNTNDCLFDSELAALRNLEQFFTWSSESANIKAEREANRLAIVVQAIGGLQ